MLSLTRTARRARALDAELDARRAVTRLRMHELHQGIHARLTAPTALLSSFLAGLVLGHFQGPPAEEEKPRGRRKPTGLRAALHYAAWALRVYLMQKTATFLRSIA